MSRAADLALRAAGGVVALAGAVLTAVIELFYTPLYVGPVRVPATLVLAVLTNVGLVWFTRTTTGSNLFALVPGLVWMGLMVVGASRTTEGDIVLHDAFGLATIFAGVAGYTFAAYRLIIPRPAPGPPAAGPPSPSPPAPGPVAGPAPPGPARGPADRHTRS